MSVGLSTKLSYPSKHDTLSQCRLNVGPTSETAGQHSIGIGLTSLVCWDLPLMFVAMS